jgi:hypothetical protein
LAAQRAGRVEVHARATFLTHTDTQDSDLRVFGSMVEQSVVMVVNLKLMIETNNLTYTSIIVYMLGKLKH